MRSKARSNGEGSVYRRRDGRWAASLRLEGGRRRTYYGRTEREARSKLRAAQRALEDGLPLTSERQTVESFLVRWLSDVAATSVRPSTYTRYRQVLLGHVVEARRPRPLGKLPLSRLSPQDLTGLYAAKLQEGLSPRTVGHIHRVLHRALRDAVRWGLVARNVCDAVDPPKVPHQEMKALSPDEARRLLGAAQDDPLEALYILAITTGMRQGELLALKWADFDPATGRLSVCRTVRWITGRGCVEWEPKSTRSRRNIHLAPMAVATLQRHRKRQAAQRLAADYWEDHDLIFCNEVGRHIEATNLLRRSWYPLLERAGLPRVRFHDLRHTAASLMLLQGVNVKVVSEMLGHSSVSLTLDVYSHVLPGLQAEAAARMEALLTASG